MKTANKMTLLSVLAVALAACGLFTPEPTATPIPSPTKTALPTLTSTPWPTNTPIPTPVPPTETPSTPALQMPTGKPASEWEGIPIMPDAIAGEGDSEGYSFTIDASLEEVQTFYETKLAKLGWSSFASGQGTTGAVMLIFMKGTDVLSVSIIPQADGILYVLLVK